MNIKHMTPEEKHQMAFDWLQNNAPDYVLKYADHLDSVRAKAEASADSAGAAIKSQGEYINKLYSERGTLRGEARDFGAESARLESMT